MYRCSQNIRWIVFPFPLPTHIPEHDKLVSGPFVEPPGEPTPDNWEEGGTVNDEDFV